MRPILILTAGFGEGHNAAARNLKAALTKIHPGQPVEAIDLFDLAYANINRISQRLYLSAINQMPWLWTQIFHVLDRTTTVQRGIGVFSKALRVLRETIRQLNPAVVVTTYPGYNHLLDKQYGTAPRPFRQATIITDSITINSAWYRCHSDWFLVANEETASVLRRASVRPESIVVTGFPVPGVFASLKSAKAIANGQLWRVLYMVNSGKLAAERTVERVAALRDIQLTVTVGKNARLQERLASMVQHTAGNPVDIYGWTPDLPRLMAESHVLISKAGGATVQESLAARTPIVINQIVPGQEEGNARLVLDNGAGVLAESPQAIASALAEAFANRGATWSAWYAAATRLSRPDAAARTAEFILGHVEEVPDSKSTRA